MIKHGFRIGMGMAAMTLAASMLAPAQDIAKKESSETTRKAKTSESDTKHPQKTITLTDLTKVSTEAAVRSAAHEAATVKSEKQAAAKEPEPASDSVTEFSLAPHNLDSSHTPYHQVGQKALKSKIHGEGYGSLDPAHSGNHQTSGAVGTTSKSGKTSVYIQGEQTRSTDSAPH